MKVHSNIAVVVLAGGASTRMGQPKQLLHFRGMPLLRHVLDIAEPLFTKRLLVLGANHEIIHQSIRTEHWQVVINAEWQTGMGSSIGQAVHVLQNEPDSTKAVLFLLADQPLITVKLLSRLVETHSCATFGITASQYGDIVGVPAIFDHKYFPELLSLDGDKGARLLIQRHLYDVQAVPFEKGAQDIDTRQDYELLIKNDKILQENYITIRYFGEIAEKTGKTIEYLNAEEVGGSLDELKAYCIRKYGLVQNGAIKLAVNQVLRESASIGPGDEVALLPPFSGG